MGRRKIAKFKRDILDNEITTSCMRNSSPKISRNVRLHQSRVRKQRVCRVHCVWIRRRDLSEKVGVRLLQLPARFKTKNSTSRSLQSLILDASSCQSAL